MSKILKEIYDFNPYQKGFKNETFFDEKKVGSPIYGEITQKGTETIIKKFSEHFNENTVFYDLGSGLGKMVSHIGIACGCKSIGIEYSKERHNGALTIKDKLLSDYESISFKNGNVLDFDISDATVVYIDNTVFPEEVTMKMYESLSSGCLVLYKLKLKLEGENVEPEDTVDRTYNQGNLSWIIKP